MFKKSAILTFIFALYGCGGSGGSSTPDPTDPPESDLFDFSQPAFQSPLDLTADPSVIRVDDDTLHLYYSAENMNVGLVVSEDNGLTWGPPDGNINEDYVVFSGRPTEWDQVIETVDVVAIDDELWMYYAGYREGTSGVFVDNYEVGLAISTDGGLSFVRDSSSIDGPILSIDETDEAAMDRHAITSANVQRVGGEFFMSYTGWNVTDDFASPFAGFFMLGATSDDGITWEKISGELFTVDDVDWMSADSTINETSLNYLPDGTWYIFFTAEEGIGFARATSFFGPYSFGDGPSVVREFSWHSAELVAPDVLIEPGVEGGEDLFRIWYAGSTNSGFFPSAIGYAERALEN